VQFAIARADVTLSAAVIEDVPIAAGQAFDRLIHVVNGLSFGSALYLALAREHGKMRTGTAREKVRPAAVAGQFYPVVAPDASERERLTVKAEYSKFL